MNKFTVLFVFVFLFSLMEDSAEAKHLEFSKIQSVIQSIGSQITLDQLLRVGLIQRYIEEENVFIIHDQYRSDDTYYFGHELESARILSRYLGLPILLVDNLFGNKKMMAFDGIIFDGKGSPKLNLSIKSSTVVSDSITNKIKYLLSHSFQQIAKGYDFSKWKSFWELKRQRNRETSEFNSYSKSLSSDQRLLMYSFCLQLFGLKEKEARETLIVFDFTTNRKKLIDFAENGESSIKIINLESPGNEHTPIQLVKLDLFQKNLQEKSHLYAYIIFTSQSSFIIYRGSKRFGTKGFVSVVTSKCLDLINDT